MTEEAIRVQNRTRKQAVSILEGDDLTAVQVAGQDQVIAVGTGSFPDSRVMRAEDANIPIDRRRGVGAGDDDESLVMRDSRRSVVDPSPAAVFDSLPYAIHPNPLVVVAAYRQNDCDFAELADQPTQAA